MCTKYATFYASGVGGTKAIVHIRLYIKKLCKAPEETNTSGDLGRGRNTVKTGQMESEWKGDLSLF